MYCETNHTRVKCLETTILLTVDGRCPLCDHILKFEWEGNPNPVTKYPEFKRINYCPKCKKSYKIEPAPKTIIRWWYLAKIEARSSIREIKEIMQEDQKRYYDKKGEKKAKKRKKPLKKPCLFFEV